MPKTLTLTEVEEELKKIEYISDEERATIMEALQEHTDLSGITAEELLDVIRKLRDEHKISDVDEKYLKALAESLE